MADLVDNDQEIKQNENLQKDQENATDMKKHGDQ